jgi:ribosomal protein S1
LDTYAFLPTTLTHYYRSHPPDRVLASKLKVHVRSVKNTQIMVSHKEFLDEAYSKLAIGDVCDAVVAKILDGRLLIYLPDSELYATVSMSELSWSLEDTIADFCPGQQVRVRITKKGGLEKIVPASVSRGCQPL